MLNKTRLTDLYRITDLSNTTMRQLKIAPSITKRDGEILDKYLQEIGREEMLTPDQAVELARRIHEGNRNALDRLVRANLRFVVSVAKQYPNQGMALPDLINEATSDLSRRQRNSTRPAASSLSATPCGGYARAFSRP